MERAFLAARKPSCPCHPLTVIGALCALLFAPSLGRGQTYGPNLMSQGDFSGAKPTYIPWAGVDDKGNLHGIEGQQLSVAENGLIGPTSFGPGIAVADLNGDGKQDIMLADTVGFFWYFQNSGTAQKPAFTQGEIAPIWLGEERVTEATEGAENVVPRIQLVDFGAGKYDVIAGTYAGKLFHIPNDGSSTQPDFKPTYNRDVMTISTRGKGELWCNYLSPFLTNLLGPSSTLNLVLGEGTYSANSIYQLDNTGSTPAPSFSQDHTQRIIAGMGLEQLTPVVLDWNGDGKADVITGDRTGFITLYLNTSSDPDHPTFAPGTHVKFGGLEKIGNATTIALADLTGNHLPNFVIGRDDGIIQYALNTGKPGAPVFNTPLTPIKGVLPPGYHYLQPTGWYKDQAYGDAYELLACVNPQEEPGFTFPEGEKTKYAFRFSLFPAKNVTFPQRYLTQTEDDQREHLIRCRQGFDLKMNTRYRVHFWVKGDGNLTTLRYRFFANRVGGAKFRPADITNPVDVSSSWTEFSSEIESRSDDPDVTTYGFSFQFRFNGQPTFYIDDVQIQQVQ